jgi:hypothetical protein
MKTPLGFMVLVGFCLSSHGGDLASSYKDAVLADKPFAYYRLDESAATEPVADEAGNNTGVYVNNPRVGVPGAIATDRESTAVSFDREREQYVKLTAFERFGSSLSSGFSAEYWLKTADSSDHQTIFDSNKPEHGATAFVSDIAANPKTKQLRLYCRDDHSNRFDAMFTPGGKNVDIYDDRWHQIVFVYDPTTPVLADQVLLYIDACRQELTVGRKKAAPMPSNFDAAVTLAASDPGGAGSSVRYNLQGSLDEVAFYLRPLSEAQIISHYRAAGGERK